MRGTGIIAPDSRGLGFTLHAVMSTLDAARSVYVVLACVGLRRMPQSTNRTFLTSIPLWEPNATSS